MEAKRELKIKLWWISLGLDFERSNEFGAHQRLF